MARTREVAAGVLGTAMLAGAGAYLYLHYRVPPVPPLQPEAQAVDVLKIPTVDEICKTLGQSDGDALKQCQADQNSGQEFVVAWMAYNNFIVDGAISLDQIQAMASLDTPSFLGDPTIGLDASLGADPSIDPSQLSDSGVTLELNAPDPGNTAQSFLTSPAQIALYCLQMSGDWVTMHDCITENDTSSGLGSGLGIQ